MVMTTPAITLVGRSSSHFTRTARIFALELGVVMTMSYATSRQAQSRASRKRSPA